MTYYVEGFRAGIADASGAPVAYVSRGISTDFSNGIVGTALAIGKGFISTGLTANELNEKINEYASNPMGFFSEIGSGIYFIENDNNRAFFSDPFTISNGYYTCYVIYPDGTATINTFNQPLVNNPNTLVFTLTTGNNPNVTTFWLDSDSPTKQTFAFPVGFSISSYIELDASTVPDIVEPIPPDNSDLPSPGITRFGLILGWSEYEVTVDDYNVRTESTDFDNSSFILSNNGQTLEIIAPFDGILDVDIFHNVYDVSATGHYGVVQTGPYDEGGVQGPSGGDGTFDDGESDDIRQLIPPGSAGPDTSNLGLYTRYLMTASQLQDFGDYLYADNLVESITNGIMKALFDSPAEAVISLMHYPFDVSSLVSTSGGTIWYGNLNTGKSSSGIMNNSSARIEWGTISLSEFWGNFLDYAPHTKIDLYLPWCVGSVPIDPHECLPGTLEVITNIEFDKGTCIHSVIGNKNAVIGTYSGVVGTQIPVTALDSSGKALAFVTAAVAGAVSAGATGAATSAGIRAANSWQTTAATVGMSLSERNRFTENVIRQAEAPYRSVARGARNTALASSAAAFRVPPNITRNGSFSGNGASLGVQVPYIILSRPTQSVPQNYGRYYGYPSNIYSSLGSLSGYTEVGSIHLDGFSCTVEERNEIEELLTGGVIL